MEYRERITAVKYLLPVALAIFFLAISFPSERRAPWYIQIWWTVLSPPQKLFTSISNSSKDTWSHYFQLVDAAKENDSLKLKLNNLEDQISKLTDIKLENERLRSLLAYKENLKIEGVVARVIANDPLAEFQSLVIDKGSNDGIKIYMPVIGSRGLVGRIGEVGRNESRILLITDPNSAVDAFIQRTRQRVLIVGDVGDVVTRPHYYLSRLEYLSSRSDVQENDEVVTSGLDQVFIEGIPVGTIHKVENSKDNIFKSAEVVPYENMAELVEVMVLKTER